MRKIDKEKADMGEEREEVGPGRDASSNQQVSNNPGLSSMRSRRRERTISSAKRAIVLDAAALILGFTEVGDTVAVTSNKVLEEARDRDARYRVLAAQEGGLIRIMEPEPAYVSEVREAARKLGEIELSDADISVIALALQLFRQGWDTCILTSDYSIQNLALRLGLMVKPILHQGIRRVISWEVYCGACGWSGNGRLGDPCPRCGHILRRRPRRER